jgi:hypothetical protein
MTILDRVLLLLAGLTAIYLLWKFFTHYQRERTRHDLYYMVSFAVLLVAGLLLIAFTYAALANPLVVIVAVLIPAGLSLGLIAELYPKAEKAYLIFALLGLAGIAVTRFTGPAELATIVLVIVHTVCGLIIFGLPILAVAREQATSSFIGVTLGGTLIGVGGMALAFLKAGRQLLFFSEPVVFTILAPLLLLMALAFAWGFSRQVGSSHPVQPAAAVR